MAAQREPGIAWKRIETRSWYTSYRGELVIHAAKGFPAWAKDTCYKPEFAKALDGRSATDLPLSVGVCVVRILGCIKTSEMHKALPVFGYLPPVEEIIFGNFEEGRYAWLTEFVRPLPNVGPVKGKLGLWDWPEVTA
jgi:hypothetical protein